MNVNIKINYSISAALKDMGHDITNESPDILTLKVSDKFFIGGGCERTILLENSLVQNVSICSHQLNLR